MTHCPRTMRVAFQNVETTEKGFRIVCSLTGKVCVESTGTGPIQKTDCRSCVFPTLYPDRATEWVAELKKAD